MEITIAIIGFGSALLGALAAWFTASEIIEVRCHLKKLSFFLNTAFMIKSRSTQVSSEVIRSYVDQQPI